MITFAYLLGLGDDESRYDGMLTEARRLGADHALAVASWVVMNEDEARLVLDDIDPAVLDTWTWPNLSGEFADDLTPDTVVRDLGIDPADPSEWCQTCTDEVCAAWQESAESTFSDALQAVALRTLGHVDDALRLERQIERRAER